MREIVTQAADIELTTVEQVMQQGQILDTTEAPFVYECVKQARGLIERYCNRRFAWQSLIERVACPGGYELLLYHRPVISVEGITYRGTAIDVADLLVTDSEAGIIQNTSPFVNTGVPENFIVGQPSPYVRAPDYAVEYLGGYVCKPAYSPPVAGEHEGGGEPGPGDPGYPGGTVEAEEAPDDVPAIPEDLVALATDLALIRFDDRRRNLLRTSESENGARADYRTIESMLSERAWPWRWTQ